MRKWTILTVVLTLTSITASSADAGLFSNLWELEKKKNAWIMRTFFGRGEKKPQNQVYYYYHSAPTYSQYQPATIPEAAPIEEAAPIQEAAPMAPVPAPETTQATPVPIGPSAAIVPPAPAVE